MSNQVPTWEIHQALARLAHLADGGGIEEYLDLYTADAVWEITGIPQAATMATRRAGRADIRDGVVSRRDTGGQGPGSATQHVVHTIEVTDRDRTAPPRPTRTTPSTARPPPRAARHGPVHDTWASADGGWKPIPPRIGG